MDVRYDLFMAAVAFDIIKISGSHYKFGNNQLGQGKDASLEKFCNDEKLYQKISDAYYNEITPDYMKDPEFLKKLEEKSAKDIEEDLDSEEAQEEVEEPEEPDNFDQEE
jgi:hypothetical protein